MNEPKFINELTKREKNQLKKGDICFDNQEHKLALLNKSIELIEKVLNEHRKDKDVTNYMHFKLLEYFLKEYREILEQYELDINWIDDDEKDDDDDDDIGEQDESV